jgi:hypothetical protein
MARTTVATGVDDRAVRLGSPARDRELSACGRITGEIIERYRVAGY